MGTLFTSKNGVIQIFDGANYGFTAKFEDSDFSGPMGRRAQTEKLITDRGQLNAGCRYVVEDIADRLAPVDISFSFYLLDTDPIRFVDWLTGNVSGAISYGTPSSFTSAGNGGTLTFYSPISFGSTSANIPNFVDTVTKDTVHLEILWQTADANANRMLIEYDSCLFLQENMRVQEGINGVKISASGQCYGNIKYHWNASATALTTLTEPSSPTYA